MGQWIEKHKEAVYQTRAYSTYGYGQAKFEKGEFGGQSATMDYNQNDIRFTVSKDKKCLYVFALGLPTPNSTIEIHDVAESKIKRISVVGSGVDVEWSMTDNILALRTPDSTDMDELATVFKVEFK